VSKTQEELVVKFAAGVIDTGGKFATGVGWCTLTCKYLREFSKKFEMILMLLSVPEFIDPVFTKTSPKRSFSLNRKRAFWLVFAKTGSIISGTVAWGKVIREKT
jgi:hypothetical protein